LSQNEYFAIIEIWFLTQYFWNIKKNWNWPCFVFNETWNYKTVCLFQAIFEIENWKFQFPRVLFHHHFWHKSTLAVPGKIHKCYGSPCNNYLTKLYLTWPYLTNVASPFLILPCPWATLIMSSIIYYLFMSVFNFSFQGFYFTIILMVEKLSILYWEKRIYWAHCLLLKFI